MGNVAKVLASSGCHERQEAPQSAPPVFFLVDRCSSWSTGRLMQPAEKPDEKDDRKGNSNQPEQKTATHSVSSVGVCSTNVPREARFRESDSSRIGRRRRELSKIVKDVTARQTTQPAGAGNILAGLRVMSFRLACSDRCRFLRRQLHATGPRRARRSPCAGMRWRGRRIASAPELRRRGAAVEGRCRGRRLALPPRARLFPGRPA